MSETTYWEMLRTQDRASVCKRTLATFDSAKRTYMLTVADRPYEIVPETQSIVPKAAAGSSDVDWDIRLLILAYLTGASETSLVGKWISPIELSGGELFFSSDAHNLSFAELLLTFKFPEDFARAGERIGAKRHTIGDASFVLQTLPRIPLLFIYWAGDEEVPSKISVLVDASAPGHLAIDGLWLAIRVTEKRLLQEAKLACGSNMSS